MRTKKGKTNYRHPGEYNFPLHRTSRRQHQGSTEESELLAQRRMALLLTESGSLLISDDANGVIHRVAHQ